MSLISHHPALSFSSKSSDHSESSLGKTTVLKTLKTYQIGTFSRKVFVGGLPFDASERDIRNTFRAFGPLQLDWPRRTDNGVGGGRSPPNDRRHERGSVMSGNGGGNGGGGGGSECRQSNGYVFLIFNDELSVHKLLEACLKEPDRKQTRYFLKMMVYRTAKLVQIRPWTLSDYRYMPEPETVVNRRYTVFVGGVPRPTRAIDIVRAHEELYGEVAYASIDVDPELRYPKGAARVTFTDRESYVNAMKGRYIYIPHGGQQKRIEVKPYIVDEQPCGECSGSRCNGRFARYFCADPHCLQYYCEPCWEDAHSATDYGNFKEHLPYIRTGDSTRLCHTVPHLSEGNGNAYDSRDMMHHRREVTSRFNRVMRYSSNVSAAPLSPSPIFSHNSGYQMHPHMPSQTDLYGNTYGHAMASQPAAHHLNSYSQYCITASGDFY